MLVCASTGTDERGFGGGLAKHTFGGAKELGIVCINIIRGAKEPRNLQNHRGVGALIKKQPLISTFLYFQAPSVCAGV